MRPQHVVVSTGDREEPRLFRSLHPRPQVLMLNACFWQTVLERFRKAGGEVWPDTAIVTINAETPIEVGASVAFQTQFLTALLLQGDPVGEALEAAQRYVADDPDFGDLTVASGETPPSAKFQLQPGGEAIELSAVSDSPQMTVVDKSPHKGRIRRTSERFVGRQRPIVACLDGLLPRRAGIGKAERRVVTLTKEGGIGKTALAGVITDWVAERELFSGGVFELSCEPFTGALEWLSQLLNTFGMPLAAQRGDLLALLSDFLSQTLPAGKAALLVLDNLDDLFTPGHRAESARVLEAALTAAPDLHVLATCRWPLGLGEHEQEIEVSPLDAEEALAVFLSHLPPETRQNRTLWTGPQADGAAHELIALSGRHPQSLALLARQMGRKGMTLERLRDEARADLLEALKDPLASDDETDRLKKVEVSQRLSYRHLSEPAKRLFERLYRLPGGIWCRVSKNPFLDTLDLAPCLGTLGTVLRDLGERTDARDAFDEALGIFYPFWKQWPKAFDILRMLRNYTTFTEETDQDPWWAL